MERKLMVTAVEIVSDLGVSRAYAYNLIKRLNAELEAKGYITISGKVADLYKVADIFVFSSYQEGLPVAVMEAMASGLPCVVSKIRGNTDLLENAEGGFLCDPQNASEFAEKLDILASNTELREKMGRNNLTAIKRFGIETVLSEMRKIYDAEVSDC